MDLLDRDAMDLVGPAYIDVSPGAAQDASRFIAVTGDIDGRHLERDGCPAVVFSWVGMDDCDEASGRGWAIVAPDDTLSGSHLFPCGDDSALHAELLR
jgi:hypothetical protein